MKLKDRFKVYRHINKGYRDTIVDNKTGKALSDLEAERILQEEYGFSFSARSKHITDVLDVMYKHIESYNESCGDGFEITIEDIINHFRSKKL